MPRIVKQPDIVQTLLEMQKRITKLENAPKLTASDLRTNGNSRLSVSNVAGQTVFEAGDLAGSTPGTVLSGIGVFRPGSGSPAFAASSGPSSVVYGFIDQGNHTVLQTNEISGYGLEDPSIPLTFYPNINIPSTASGTPTLLWLGEFNCTHQYLDVIIQAAVSGGATGQVQLQVGGTVVGTQVISGAGFVPYTFTNMSATGTNQKTILTMGLFASITAGAGTLQVLVQHGRLHGSLG